MEDTRGEQVINFLEKLYGDDLEDMLNDIMNVTACMTIACDIKAENALVAFATYLAVADGVK